MKVFLLLCVIPLCYSALYQVPPSPDHPGECFHEGVTMKPNEVTTLKARCEKLSCNTDFYITGETCAYHTENEYCKETAGDSSKPYPDCCPGVECNFPEGVEQTITSIG